PNMSQEDRGVLRLGDKTTRCPRCGEMGVIAEGSQIFKWYDIPTALDGARIQCGCPPGSNRLIAIAGSPPAGTAPAASPRSASTPTSAQPAAQPAAPARSASPSSWTGTPVRPSTEDNQPVEPGFYIVPKSINRRALEAELFGDAPSPDVLRKFHGLNGSLGDDIVKAGQLVVLSDPRNSMCMREEAHLMQAAEEVAEVLKALTPEDADFMTEHQAQIASILGSVSTWAGVATAGMEKHLDDITRSLQRLEALHADTYRTYGRLNVPEFFAKRTAILAELDGTLLSSAKARSFLSLGNHSTLKKSLRISSKSLVHHWKKAGGPGPIPGYSSYIESVSRATTYMKYGGYLAIGIGGISSILTIKQACETGSTKECTKVAITESLKFSGMSAGGIYGASLGVQESAFVCYKLSKDPRKFSVCTIAVVAASSYWGAELGAHLGEAVGESTVKGGEVIHDLFLYD
ncbi:PAAR domain-containing protein, partial [Pseudomonas sp. 147P]